MTALLLLAVVLLILANGFFVAAEFALVRTRRSHMEELAAEGRRNARLVVTLMDDLSEYLSACQFGITLASLGIGFLGEPAIAELLEPLFGGLSHGVATFLAIAIAYILVTALHITTGEQVPKIYAIVKAEPVAMRVSRPLGWFNAGMRPFISALNHASNAMLRTLRIDPNAEFEEGSSPGELRVLIAQARSGG
ncbi:MAG TPA: CNNM domain-containing protein, partial [Solirubrobacteraceae bacterium]|nr:CNNM domain-containing protein [Solirubrobacteraceae bacterium]